MQFAAAASVAIITTSLPNGVLGEPYSAVVKPSGGCTPYSWKIVSGSLPAGVIDLMSRNGTYMSLTGVPTIAKSYSFTVAVTDCGGLISKKSYTIVIQLTADHVVGLKWRASTSTGIAGYNVYRGSDGVHFRKINRGGLVAATLYDDFTVADSSTYYYAATAVNIYGKESVKTAAVKAVIP